MIKYLYPKVISIDTIPKMGKQYGLRFTWKATEPLTNRNVADFFAIIPPLFMEKYSLNVVRIMGAYPETELNPEIQFVPLRETDLTLRQIWDETKSWALKHYMDFTFREAVIYKTRFPWWLLAIVAGEVGGIVYVAKKKK